MRCPSSWLLLAAAIAAGCSSQVVDETQPASDRNSALVGVNQEIQPGVQYRIEAPPGRTIYVAEVDLCTPGIELRSSGVEDGSITTSEFAARTNAIVAINAAHSLNGVPTGPTAHDGQFFGGPDQGDIGQAVFGDNLAEFVHMFDTYVPQPTHREVLSGLLTLVHDGVPQHDVLPNDSYTCSVQHPRTLIGLTADRRRVILVAVDGRRPSSGRLGMTCAEAADFMVAKGAHWALNLDGGGSTTMVVAGQLVNSPSDGAQRSLPTHLAVVSNPGARGQCPPSAHLSQPTTWLAPQSPTPLYLNPIQPMRLLDTRPTGYPPAGEAFPLTSFPDGVAGGVYNVTVVDALAPGFLTVFSGASVPWTSTVNYPSASPVPNSTIVAADGSGLRGFLLAPAHVVIDATAYLSTSGLGFVPITPQRVADTRQSGDRLAAGEERTFPLGSAVPGQAQAAALNVTAVDPLAAGFLSVYPCGARPDTSNVNFEAGEIRASHVITGVTGGAVCVFSMAETDVVVDVMGYYLPGGSGFHFVPAQRVLDTRSAIGGWSGRLSPGQTIELAFDGNPKPSAVTFNLTNDAAWGPGFVRALPCDAWAEHSNLNTVADLPRGNLVTSRLSADGRLCLYTLSSTELIVDVLGFHD